MSLDRLAVVAIKRLNLLDTDPKDWQVNHKRHAASTDHIPRDDLVSAGVHNLAVVCLLWQDKSLDFVISQLRRIQIDNEFLFELLDLDIVTQVLEQLLGTH